MVRNRLVLIITQQQKEQAIIEKWLPYISLISIDIAQPDHNLIIKVVFKVNRVGANLVINIVADENTFTVGDVEDAPVATPSPIELTQINTGAY